MYMGVPALAELGRMTGKRAYFDDAVKNVLQMSGYMFNPQLNGLYTHGWNANNPDAPRFYWGARQRLGGADDVATCSTCCRKTIPAIRKCWPSCAGTLKGIAELQSGSGLWHQMLDRNDSYLETSASAIFTYVFAHAVNQGWVSPTTYGSIAQAGWAGLSTRINAKGQVEGTCVGTTFASDQVYYYNRPTSVQALHGYGPTLLAGAEIIKLMNNPAFESSTRCAPTTTCPRTAAKTDYREHH